MNPADMNSYRGRHPTQIKRICLIGESYACCMEQEKERKKKSIVYVRWSGIAHGISSRTLSERENRLNQREGSVDHQLSDRFQISIGAVGCGSAYGR